MNRPNEEMNGRCEKGSKNKNKKQEQKTRRKHEQTK